MTSYNRDKAELKVTIPLEDFAEIQQKEVQIDQVLQEFKKFAFEKQELLLSKKATDGVDNY